VWQAFVAIEDRTFFSHMGFSWRGILRSIWVNIKRFRKAQGASTITQQLARLLFLQNSKTYWRKCMELFYTLLIEMRFSKEQIIESYVNTVYFGGGIYGIQAACTAFWGVSVQEIDYVQAATLAGIVRSPSYYCPLYNQEHAWQRKNVVLRAMLECNFIIMDQYQEGVARSADLIITHDGTDQYCYIKEMIRLFCSSVGCIDLYTGGYSIQTTFNKQMQESAQELFTFHIQRLRSQLQMPINGGLLTIRVATGQVKALIGGYDFKESQFNRAWHAKRQKGSTIKPFIYACCLQKGGLFDDVQVDEPINILTHNKNWSPKNYNKKHLGPVTNAYALAHSNNIIAIKTLLFVGTAMVAELLKNAGIQSYIHQHPSLALGCIDVTLKEVAQAFNIFANQGFVVEPYFVEWIKDHDGKKVWHEQQEQKKVLSLKIVSQIAVVLQYAFQRVYKKQLSVAAIGKTGTTNDSRTCWFVGATPEYTTAIYIGCDDNRPMGERIFPIHTALPIWHEFYTQLYKFMPVQKNHFQCDNSLTPKLIDKYSGEVKKTADQHTIMILQ
jgi:penicillin-binding protein 1A